MKIKILELGALGTNCYIVICDETKKGVVIDPGGNPEKVIAFIEEQQIDVQAIINTHGHHDHIGGNKKLKEHTNADLYIHADDADMLTSSKRNFSVFMGEENCGPGADKLLKDGDVISFGECSLKAIHLPGHTRGGVGLYAEKEGVLFSGDVLFYGSIGRTDLPGSDYQQMMESLDLLMKLPDDTIVYPGHGPKTSIAMEKQINPFIR